MDAMNAGRKVIVLPDRHTWLEAIHLNNMARRTMAPNRFFSFIPLNDWGLHVPIEVDDVGKPRYTGTAAVIGVKGRPFGKRVESECDYAGSRKTVIYEVPSGHSGLVDTLLLSVHGFAPDGAPLIVLSDAKTGKPIRTEDEMLAASEVLLRFDGEVQPHRVRRSFAGDYERAGGWAVQNTVWDWAAIGLVTSTLCWIRQFWNWFNLSKKPSEAYEIAVEAGQPADG